MAVIMGTGTIDISTLGATEVVSIGSTIGPNLGITLVMAGLDATIASIKLVESNDKANWSQVDTVEVLTVGNGNQQLKTINNQMIYAGLEVTKTTSTVGTIDYIIASKS